MFDRKRARDSRSGVSVKLLLPLVLGACATLEALTLSESRGTASSRALLSYGMCNTSGARSFIASEVVVAVLYDQTAKLLKSSLDKKRGRFRATYAGIVRIKEMAPGKCLRLVRMASDELLAEFEVKIVKRGDRSAELVPTRTFIRKFATSTSPDGDKLIATVSISAAISYVNQQQFDGPLPITSLKFPIGATKYTIGRTPVDILNTQNSLLFPLVRSRPVNVAISVTEIGRGTEQLKAGLDGFEVNASALRKLLGIED